MLVSTNISPLYLINGANVVVVFLLGCMVISSGKRYVTVWRLSECLSVCLSRRRTYRDAPESSMRRGQRTFRPDCKENLHTCLLSVKSKQKYTTKYESES